MSTIAAKPTAKKATPVNADGLLNELRARYLRAQSLLTEVLDAAGGQGSLVERLIFHVLDDLLPEPAALLRSSPMDQVTLNRVYEGLWSALACLEAAKVVATGTVMHSHLATAFEVLDSLHTECDACGTLARALPEAVAKNKERDKSAWLEGKAIACAMFREIANHDDGDESSMQAGYRAGVGEPYVEQANFVLPFIEAIVRAPDLALGFSAVLCDLFVMSVPDDMAQDAENQARVTYEACTQPCEDAEADVYTLPPLDEQLRAYGHEKFMRTVIEPTADSRPEAEGSPLERAWCRLGEARAIILFRAEDMQSTALYAVERLAEMVETLIGGLLPTTNRPNPEPRKLDEASCAITELGGLLAAVNTADVDDYVLKGAQTILEAAQGCIQQAMSSSEVSR